MFGVSFNIFLFSVSNSSSVIVPFFFNEIKETYQVKSIDKKQDIVYTLSNKSYPIINISGSPEVDNINEEMKQNYVDKDDEYCSSEYNYYLNNEILSIIITHTITKTFIISVHIFWFFFHSVDI